MKFKKVCRNVEKNQSYFENEKRSLYIYTYVIIIRKSFKKNYTPTPLQQIIKQNIYFY